MDRLYRPCFVVSASATKQHIVLAIGGHFSCFDNTVITLYKALVSLAQYRRWTYTVGLKLYERVCANFLDVRL